MRCGREPTQAGKSRSRARQAFPAPAIGRTFDLERDAPGGQKKGAGMMKRMEFALTAALIFGVIFGSARIVERQHRPSAAVSPSPSVVAFNR